MRKQNGLRRQVERSETVLTADASRIEQKDGLLQNPRTDPRSRGDGFRKRTVRMPEQNDVGVTFQRRE